MSHELVVDGEELSRLTEVIHHARSEAGRNLWLIGESLRRVREEELWRAGDYENFTDYLANGALVGRSFAYKLIKIAGQFNQPVAERYGIAKLDAVARYIDVSPEDELPGDVLAADIKIRDASGRFTSLPLHQASTQQIEEATSLIRAEKASKRRPAKRYLQAAERIAEQLPPVKGSRKAGRVRVNKTQDGQLVVSFRDIPIGDIGAFLEAVSKEWGS